MLFKFQFLQGLIKTKFPPPAPVSRLCFNSYKVWLKLVSMMKMEI